MTASIALIELLTEELPPGFLATLPEKLTNLWGKALSDARLIENEGDINNHITVWLTPRRIAVQLTGLPEQQPGQTIQHKGPPLRIAFDADGTPTRAAEAFAKKCGVSVNDLNKTDIGKETVLTYTEDVTGQPTPTVLGEIILTIVDALQGPRFMRWGNYDLRFPRPIHGLVALWNDDVIPATVHHLTAGRTTMGHRLLANHAVSIPSAGAYSETLASDGHIMVDAAQRRATIVDALETAAKKAGGQWIANDDLLNEVVAITEQPWVFTGTFAEDYLALPKPVIVTVMASHQRYFAVEKPNGELLPVFLGVSNGVPKAESAIVAGNERVLRARFNDATFFLDADMAKPLADRVDDLAGITFQRGLGTLAEKTQRLEILAPKLASDLGLSETGDVAQAARLAKTDLTTQMVFEFTELEGLIGQAYARRQGLSENIATALAEQYQPRFQGDVLPTTDIGRVLSLTDKLDTLVCVLSQPKVSMPTGSKDPLGLRRMVNGILLMLMTGGTPTVNFENWANAAYEQVPLTEKADWETVWTERFRPFVLQRLNSLLTDQGMGQDIQQAVIADGILGVPDVLNRLPHLTNHQQVLENLSSETLVALLEPANRLQRILGKHYSPVANMGEIDPKLFETDQEKQVYDGLNAFWTSQNDSAWQLLTAEQVGVLVTWQQPIAAFFDAVMVNADDAAVKENRYQLLRAALTAYYRLGNLTQLRAELPVAQTEPIAV